MNFCADLDALETLEASGKGAEWNWRGSPLSSPKLSPNDSLEDRQESPNVSWEEKHKFTEESRPWNCRLDRHRSAKTIKKAEIEKMLEDYEKSETQSSLLDLKKN
jgi:hypothetical protein